MCGFAGYLETGPDGAQESPEVVAGRMTSTLTHRGPDDGATWVDREAGFALGHRRLAIVELSALGAQPMESAGGRYVVAYNGEIYNFRDLRAELVGLGAHFRGSSDTEVLLAAIEQWGVTVALQRFVGMFAFALWDRRERALYLCRDRMGEKPLYFGWAGSTFLFGSELKALRAHPSWLGRYDRGAISLFLRYCYVPAPFSIYEGIRKLSPGTFLHITDWTSGVLPEPTVYWSAREAYESGRLHPFAGSRDDAVDELDRLLRQSIRQQMIADVPLGAFLSGGIDSSTIVALMQEEGTVPTRTFSIGFHEARFNEAQHAALVADHLGTEHEELYVTPQDAMGVVPLLPDLYDEPFADSSQIPTYLVCSLARQSVTVGLSGDGGDELFGGYVRHILGSRIWNAMRRVPAPLRRMAGKTAARIPADAWNSLGGALKLLPESFRRAPGEKVQKVAGMLQAPDPSAIYRSLVSSWANPEQALPGVVEPGTLASTKADWPHSGEFADQMMYLDAVTYLPDDILVKVDRAAMGVSLETRVPFLDHRVVEFAFSLPLSYKIDSGVGKWPLRQVLYRYVPRELVDRPKAGFAVPVGQWLRGPLRAWAEELLDAGRLADEGVFEPAIIRKYWEQHLSGSIDRTFELWCVLMFQAWKSRTDS